MTATIFEIIGSIFIVLFIFLLLIILPLISRMLKSVNQSFSSAKRDVKMQVGESISEMETAKREIDSLKEITVQFKSALDSALEAMDLTIDFLNSRAFKYSLIGGIWFLFGTTALPRGLHSPKEIKPVKKSIPPPSWKNT